MRLKISFFKKWVQKGAKICEKWVQKGENFLKKWVQKGEIFVIMIVI